MKQTKEGWWIVESDTHIGRWIEESGRLDHDRHLVPLACEYIPEGGVVIDCGSLYGDHAIAYSEKVGPTGMVIAIEPGIAAFECLIRNVNRFKHPNVKPIRAALSDKPGTCLMVGDINLGMNSCTEGPGDTTVMELDDLARIIPNRLDFIKIDCEGFEMNIIQGAFNLIEKFKPVMMIEMNSQALARQGYKYQGIYQTLKSLGYQWQICQPQCSADDPQYDIIATPQKTLNPPR